MRCGSFFVFRGSVPEGRMVEGSLHGGQDPEGRMVEGSLHGGHPTLRINGPPSHRTPRPLLSIATTPNLCSAGDSEQSRPYWRERAGGQAGRRAGGQAGRRAGGQAGARTHTRRWARTCTRAHI
jgi:hypothetical protein